MKKSKIINRLLIGALTLAFIGVGVILYWLNQPTDVLEIKNAPFPVRTIRETAHRDGVVILKIDYCKKIKATGRVRTSYVSKTREVLLPISEDKQEPACREVELPVLVPRDLQPDEYRIHFRVIYDINPLKRAEPIEFESQPFKVDE